MRHVQCRPGWEEVTPSVSARWDSLTGRRDATLPRALAWMEIERELKDVLKRRNADDI
jgi:hypothetical protein